MEVEEKLQRLITNFRISLSLERLIQEIAKERSMTKAEVIRQAIRLGLPTLRAQP